MSTTYPDLNLTNFPESVDSFVQMMDIIASDAPALKAYQDAMETGNVAQASAALAGLSNANNKLLTANKINKISDALVALQRFYGTNITPYVQNLQTNWQNEIDKFEYKGVFNSATAYIKNNVVSYVSGIYTLLYLCIRNTTAGILPTDTTYWRLFTVIGERGASGGDFSFVNDWDSTTSYTPNDCVIHNGILWGCVTANVNSEPTPTNNNWDILMNIGASFYPIQATAPVSQDVGQLWFQTIGSEF